MGNVVTRYRHRRAVRKQQGRKGRTEECVDCAACADCSPFMLSPLLLLLRVVPGAFRADAVDPWVARPVGPLGRAAARLIRSYQVNVSVPRARPVCTMTPTCSRYGLQAVSRHGSWRGGVMVLRRLRRCAGTGPRLDPVAPTQP
ncbi:membrane protein insertion efficiency factor YidD [Nocardioides plantarum]|uniref:Membrane protein insertion efficiency factor YidD n=1 Tax=Nocardioides plantarum TaxID=29299 RepID=A0ABV5KHZ9_9ACTN|nr:membrane protein insertion efficiency factor YidD [Nocardioides plantarum]